MKAYKVGMLVRYKVNEFDGHFTSDCRITEVEDDHAIATELDTNCPMRLWVDDDTDYMFTII